MTPVAFSIQVTEEKTILQAEFDSGQGTGDFSGDKGFSAHRAFVVEEDAIAGVEAIGLTVVHDNPVTVHLGDGVGAAGVERGSFFLRDFLHLAVEFAGAGLVEAGFLFEAEDADGVEQAQYAEGIRVGGVFGFFEADSNVALGGEIVDLVGLGLLDDPDEARTVRHIAMMEEEAHIYFVTILDKVVNSVCIEEASAALDSMDDVALVEQEFGKIRTVLASDASDEGDFRLRGHMVLLHSGAEQLCCLEICIGKLQSLLQANYCLPTEGVKPGAVHQLAHGTIRFTGIECDFTLVIDDLTDGFSEFLDRDIVATADIDVA